jgi:chromosome segregation ATPase
LGISLIVLDMQARYKIVLFLSTITLALGALVFLLSREDETAIFRFRWLLFNHPIRNFSDAVTPLVDGSPGSLWYVGLSLFAMIITGIVFKYITSGELQAFRDRLVDAEVAKAELEALLQDSLWKERHARAARDAALKDLEASLSTTFAAQDRLSETEKLLRSRDRELHNLRPKAEDLTQPIAADSIRMREQTELRDQLRKKTDLLQEKDSAIQQLEKILTERIDALETQLNVKQNLINERDKELEVLRAQLTKTGAAKNQAENFLAEELKKEKQALKAKDSATKELEKNLTAKVRALESQMSEKQELLQSRSTELQALRSEVAIVTGRLTDVVSAKERTETALQQELKNKTELLRSKDAAFKELQTRTAKVNHLENQLPEKDAFLKDHNTELASLRAQLTKMGSAKKEIEDLLQEERRKAVEVLKAKDSTIKELEVSSKKTVDALKDRIGEQQTLLRSRDEELQALRSEMNTLNDQLTTARPATDQTRSLAHEESSNESTIKTFGESLKEVQALESLLHEKEDLLKSHDQKIERLESKLKEKRTALAKHEIGAWQAYERRSLWKQRLAKFGISIKDREL